MKTNQYRVWDKTEKAWIKDFIYLAPDGTLMEEGGWDDPCSFLAPAWFIRENFKQHQHQIPIGPKVQAEIDAEFRRRQPEWYDVEFATGYLDTAGKMIYEGDIVHIHNGGNCAITWGEFDDCCVQGEAWVYATGSPHKATLGSLCSNEEVECREVTVIGNIHETPSLLEQKAGDAS